MEVVRAQANGRASASSLGSSSAVSIRRQASAIFSACCWKREGWFGLQRLQGLKPARLGVCSRFVEADMLALCPSRRARRSAIDAGRFHRSEKMSVESGIARDKGRPSRILEGGRRGAGWGLGWMSMAHDLGPEVNAVGLDLVLAKRPRTPVLAVKPMSAKHTPPSQRPQLRASARDASCRPH